MYLEKIEKIFYGMHYEKVNKEDADRFHEALEQNPYVLNKLNTEVKKGFLSTKEEAENWFTFLKPFYHIEAGKKENDLYELAIMEALFKYKRPKMTDLNKKYYCEHIKNKFMIYDSIKSAKKVLNENLKMFSTDDNIEDLNTYITELGYSVKELSNGFYYIKSTPKNKIK